MEPPQPVDVDTAVEVLLFSESTTSLLHAAVTPAQAATSVTAPTVSPRG
jgi:hypothetical protein